MTVYVNEIQPSCTNVMISNTHRYHVQYWLRYMNLAIPHSNTLSISAHFVFFSLRCRNHISLPSKVYDFLFIVANLPHTRSFFLKAQFYFSFTIIN